MGRKHPLPSTLRATALLGSIALAAVGLAGGLAGQTASSGAGRSDAAGVAAARTSAPASFRFPKTSGPAAESAEAVNEVSPISLTASDGTGLALVALEANGVLEPPLAFTELHLTFENPRDAVIEGRFRIALPPGAALSRFAMKIGDAWQEGEVVERRRAHQAYEDFLHRRQDPALLEQEAGNEFSARVFPIPARGRKELIVSYSHALARSDEPYVIPLQGLSKVGRLDVRVLLGDRPAGGAPASSLGGEVRDRRMIELHERDWTPDRDFEIGQSQVAGRGGLRHGDLALVRVALPHEALPQRVQEIAGLYVLVDSSASRALGWEAQVRRVAELVAGLRDGAGRGTPLGIAAFDQEVVPVYEGTAGGFRAAEVERLSARRPLGASDLEGALAWLAGRLAEGGRRHPRVLLVTDGVATAGETETRALKAAVRALGASGVERLDVLEVGGLRDEAVLSALVTGNLAHDGQRLDGAAPLAEIARRLTLACRSGIEVAVEGASWVWPETLDGVQPGDEVLVAAELPAGRPLRLALDGRPMALGELATAERPLLERAWAQARIERLLHLRETVHADDEDLRRALALEVTELSVEHRVLSPFTAMLVLETEADYVRFGLDRRALADVLTVGAGGLEVLARTRPTRWAAAAAERPKQPAATASTTFRDDSRERGEQDVTLGTPVDGEETRILARVEGGVAGGVPGGVVGGVAGGVMGGVAGAAPSAAAPVQPVEVAEAAADDSPLRVGGSPPPPPPPPSPPPPPPPAARPRLRTEAVEEAITVEQGTEGIAEEIVVAQDDEEEEPTVAPYTGKFAEVMKHLAAGRTARARAVAEAWSAETPGDVMALVALGEAWEATGETAAAARAYGSLIDLFPSRADLRRLAGERLERLGEAGLELAVDTYEKAVLERPDHPSGHRLLAWALLRAGRFEEAFAALAEGLAQEYPGGRFAGADRVLREDLGLLAAAWLRAEPARREEVLARLEDHDAELATGPSLRFVLTWETDANDVDLHVWDRRGGHAYYHAPTLPSGGELYDDVTTGYGPECFTIGESRGKAAPYRLKVHYYSRGPMGYGMGTVQVVRHDGDGRLTVEPRPFVVMADHAMVDLGTVETRPGGRAAGR